MVTRRELLAAAGGLAAASGRAAALGYPLGETRSFEAPYREVRVGAGDGAVLVAASDGDRGAVAAHATDDDGLLWQRTATGPVGAPVAADGRVWVVAGGELRRLAPEGEEPGNAAAWSPPAGRLRRPVPYGDGVVATRVVRSGGGGVVDQPSWESDLRLIDGDGSVWHGEVLGAATRPAVGAGVVAAGVTHGREDPGGVVALDADAGDRLWRRRRLGTDHAPTVAGDAVVVGGDGALLGLAAESGRERWRVEDGGVERVVPGRSSEEAVAVLESGAVVGVDAARGAVRWRVEPEGGVTGVAAVGDGVLLHDDDGVLTSYLPDGEGVVGRRRLSSVAWPPAVVDGAVYLGGGEGTVRVLPGIRLAALRRIRAVQDGPVLDAVAPVAALLGHGDSVARAERAYRAGDYRAAHRAAATADRRRWLAAAVAALGAVATLGSIGMVGDQLRRRWRRRGKLERRHARAADAVEEAEAAVGGAVPALRAMLDDAEPGLRDGGDRRRIDAVASLADRTERAGERRGRLADRLAEARERHAGAAVAGALAAAADALDRADPVGATEERAIRRCHRLLDGVDRVLAALDVLEPGFVGAAFPVEEEPLAGAAPDEVLAAAADGDDLEVAAGAVERLAALQEAAGDDGFAGDAAALRSVGDDGLAATFREAIREGDADAIEGLRRRLDRRRRLRDRRAALAERLADRGSDPVSAALREAHGAIAAVDGDDPETALSRLDRLERAVDVADAVEELAAREVGGVDAVRAALADAVAALPSGDGDGGVGEIRRVVEELERVTSGLGDLDLGATDRSAAALREEAAEAAGDLDRHRLARLGEEIDRLGRRRWTQRKVAALSSATFADVVAALWEGYGYAVERRDGDVVARRDGESVLIAVVAGERDDVVDRGDVEAAVERRDAMAVDRLVVATAVAASAAAERGWSGVEVVEGGELVAMLDESGVVPPR